MPGSVPGRPGVPLMIRQGGLGVWEQPTIQLAASFAPEAFQSNAFRTQEFFDRYKTLSQDEQQAIKEGLLAALGALLPVIYAVYKRDASGAVIALYGLAFSIYVLWNKLDKL